MKKKKNPIHIGVPDVALAISILALLWTLFVEFVIKRG